MDFLGYHITSQGTQPTKEKFEAIAEFPKPRTVKELRRFLGMVNFYRSNLPNAAQYQTGLNEYLHDSRKNDNSPIVWTPEAEHAFVQCKQNVMDAITIAHPLQDAQLALFTDASASCVGAALQQKIGLKWQPLGFFSKGLSEAQKKYSTFDRELLGIYMAVRHFQRLIEGREFTIYTDHKPLTFAFTKKPSINDTPRRVRQLDYISQYSTEIQFVNGRDNVVADSLSRTIDEVCMPSPIDYAELAKSQENDVELAKLYNSRKLRMERVKIGGTSSTAPRAYAYF
jgi:hypothetical protein